MNMTKFNLILTHRAMIKILFPIAIGVTELINFKHMKQIKLLFLVLLIIGISSETFAGDKFGIRVGWQYSNLYDGSSTLGDDALNSFYLGVFKEKKIIPFLRLGGGVEYSQVGVSMSGSSDKVKFHYMSLPIYAKVKLGPVYGLLGAAPAFKVGESWDVQAGGAAAEELFDANTFDLPIFAGIGINILVLQIEARYYLGTMELSGNSAMPGIKSQQFQLGLGLTI